MEPEEIENQINCVLNYWSSVHLLDSYVVKILLDEEITNNEYKLYWERLSESVKREIYDTYFKYYGGSQAIKGKQLSYKVEYNKLI